jgi:hypothetical protein
LLCHDRGNRHLENIMFERTSLLLLLLTIPIAHGCSGCEEEPGGQTDTDMGMTGSPDMNTGGQDMGMGPADSGGDDMSTTPSDMNADSGGDTEDMFVCENTVCDGVCCDAGQECVEDLCLDPCEGTRCGEELGLCCMGQDLCLGDACVTPGGMCELTEQCDVDEICEPTVGRCVPRSAVEVCEFIPPVVPFAPEVGCTWPSGTITVSPDSNRVVVAPIVGNLTDDNGDGVTDENDSPEIIFLSRTSGCCNKRGTLRIVDGQCNADNTMNTIASLDSVLMANDSAPALGDLDNDGVPEIVAVRGQNLNESNGKVQVQGLVAWKRTSDDGTTWEPMWENETYPTAGVHTNGGATVAIADLDGDGNPEVIVGNVVINGQDGTLKWDGVETSMGTGGIGNNAFLGPASAVGDVDLDGNQEIAAGNTLYDHDGTVLWTYEYMTSNSGCQGSLACDGYNAMAEFDGDLEGEVVIIREGELFIINHDGTLFWQQQIIKDDCTRGNESGPPTIADFDGDGRPEVGTAAADFYTVMDLDCDVEDWEMRGCRARGVLWATPNEDCSSRATASSVFDFEGDGKAEMVYADENTFRILDGTDGTVLYEDTTHSSNTRIEMPLVADVDNDGNSEIVIPSDTGASIKVLQDPGDNWVRTRRIWNQHAYSVTNINEDGTVPAVPGVNWLNGRLNNFRQNTQPGGLFDAPNLVVASVEAQGVGCGETREVSIRVEVTNAGALGLPAGTPVRIYGRTPTETVTIEDATLMQRLLPGQSEIITTVTTIPEAWIASGYTIGAIADPDATVNECVEDDNEVSVDGEQIPFNTPDLSITAMSADGTLCGATLTMPVEVTLRNDGTQPAPANIPIVFTIDGIRYGQVTTMAELQPGEEVTLSAELGISALEAGQTLDITATVDPDTTIYDCEEQISESIQETCESAG